MKKTIITLLCSLFVTVAIAQDIKRPESYNYVRGIEAIEAENFHEASEYLNKEIKENPKNGYAYAWMAIIYNRNEEYGKAISVLNQAIKFIPKKDKYYRSWSYNTKSQVYKMLGDYTKALNCITEAIAILPEDKDCYQERAQLYFEMGNYDAADKDYNKLIAMDSGDIHSYMGLGRNEKMRKNFSEAIKHFDYVIKLDNEYSSGYAFRGECYIALGKYNEAATDLVKALSINQDRKAFHHMQELADSCLAPIVTKLKIEEKKSPTEGLWPYYLGIVYEHTNRYSDAAYHYLDAYKLDANPVLAYRLSNCLDELGEYDKALEYINFSILSDSTDCDYLSLRASIYDNMGLSQKAIQDFDKYISLQPEEFFAYYGRGWIKDHTGDTDGALEDYSTAILLEPNYGYTYLNRGVLYRLQGKTDLAKADFEKVVALDSLKEEQHTPYALYYLGHKQEAIDFMNNLMKKGENKSICYEAACLYSIMNDVSTSIMYLRKSIELGHRDFNHFKRDRDLNNIRQTAEFKELIQEVENTYMNNAANACNEELVMKVVEIPFTKENGICKVKCAINDLPLHFIFDTGASDVSISSVEASFMLKNDYLKANDIKGKQNYLNANGDISEGTVINLRTVTFGGLILENVKASVVKNQKAPLLLGQSVLNRLGKIEIDNENRILKVTYKN